MESADINAAFRETFRPLRQHIRRGMSNEGQIYAIEMDPCIPGELLATEWVPPATRGLADAALLANTSRRRDFFARLLAENRPEALFAYVCEQASGPRQRCLYVEVVSADGLFGAEHLIRTGRGWHHRDLVQRLHRRLGPLATA